MCYILFLSTDSTAELSTCNSSLLQFSRELPDQAEVALLEHPQKWFVGSRSGCSCDFRHLTVESVELGFDEPVDWYPEEPEAIEATLAFIKAIRPLVDQGARVDCIDTWNHDDEFANLAGTTRVDLSRVDDRAFRFYENHRFVFIAQDDQQTSRG
jgi:hypothetical protein